MIRMVQSTSAGHAKGYFTQSLLKADYYINEQELQGRFEGRLAERLGIEGAADKEVFFALCDNKHPKESGSLTPRTNDERTVGYDINFHCPKSVSIVHALAKDDHVMDAFKQSISETMRDIQADTQTRVRKSGKQQDRTTSELVWADFVHQTARPVDERAPDPHLHSHCFVFNVTWDEQEKLFKAGKFHDIKRDMPYYQARFHKRLADKMVALGYEVRKTNSSFEIEGVPQRVIKLFSKRTDEIGRVAKEKGITNAKDLDALGARTRSKKQKGMGMAELKVDWKKQIQELEEAKEQGEAAKAIRFGPKKAMERLNAKDCLDHAVSHSFERASVMGDRKLLQTAYRHALGNTAISIDSITEGFRQDERLLHIRQGRRTLCTTREVLKEERYMVDLAHKGQGKVSPLYDTAPALRLNDEQAAAVSHVLTTSNRVSIIRGAAGTGKTTLMREAVEKMEAKGKKVTVVAPTAQASRGVLKEEGFEQAETVAKLLTDQQLQDSLQDQVLWVDEAGLLGTKDMVSLLELTDRKNVRLILGGDTRQHASVVRGDALRILNTVGGIQSAEVSKIYRQKDVQYRAAVEDLSKGNIRQAFDKLDGMGSIKTVDAMQPNVELVEDYVAALKKGKSVLVISPTHKQGEEVTETIRVKMRQLGMIGKKELALQRLPNLNLTVAEKGDWRNYHEGLAVQFNQNIKGIKRGSRWSVKSVQDKQVELINEFERKVLLPKDKADSFDVFAKKDMSLSKGDKVQITRNGFDKKDRRLNNGQTLEVVSVDKKGKIKLLNKASKAKYELDQEFGHLNHAHCITSHASQGKTVDEVFIAQPSGTFGATDAKQFCVSVSRGRDVAHIYTDDKETLLIHASELGERQSALELVQKKNNHLDYVQQHSRVNLPNQASSKAPEKKTSINKVYKDRNYEPSI